MNRQFMTPGAACRCFHCLGAFLADQIGHWIDEGKTAICPYCGIDSVLSSSADALSDPLIRQLYAAYFGASKKFTDVEWRKDLANERRPQRGVVVGGQ